MLIVSGGCKHNDKGQCASKNLVTVQPLRHKEEVLVLKLYQKKKNQ
jgi:hypothetical protein